VVFVSIQHHSAVDLGTVNLGDEMAVVKELAAHPLELSGLATRGNLNERKKI